LDKVVQTNHSHRWQFIVALALMMSGAAGHADEPARVVHLGFVSPFSPSTDVPSVNGFWQRLRELGWMKGQNLIVEERWAEGRPDRLPALMAEVIDRKIEVLVTYSTPGALAAKNATRTIPIVVTNMADPVRSGVTVSLAHPDANVTGLSLAWTEGTAGKLLELLQETVPHLSTVAMIANLQDPQVTERAKEVQTIAPERGIKIRLIEVRSPEALDQAFKRARKEAQAVLVLSDLLTFEHRGEVAALAIKYRLAAMYPLREYVEAGGLMSYGADRVALFRRAAEYVDKILKGTKPSDLPFEQPTQYEFIINLKTARATSITIPPSISARANEVIQ
jgi:putative ABC transport system substrate-binding protein